MFAEGIHNRSGTTLSSRYSLVKHLGAGATGHVYLAKDLELGGTEVAVKILFPHLLAQSNSLERFRSEVNIVRTLSHKNVIKVFGLEKNDEGLYFLVMEYFQGISLSEYLSRSPDNRLPLDAAHWILHEICDAVAHAHEHGVIHRDLKPQNVLIAESGLVKVCDFGLARQLGSENALTRTGESLGTPYYMAPEIFKGETIDERTDVYALGIMSYELLSGRRPFEAEAFYSLALAHIQSPLPPFPAELYLPNWMKEITQRSTQKEKADRFPAASSLAQSLREHLGEETKKRNLQFTEEWKDREKTRIQLLRKRKRKKFLKKVAWLALILVLLISLACRIDARQRWVFGVPALELERKYGAIFTPWKWILGIYFVPSEQELRDRIFAIAPKRADEREDLYLEEGKRRSFEVRMLMDLGVNPNTLDYEGKPLILTLTNMKLEDLALTFADAKGFNPNIRNPAGTPLINIAVENAMRKLAVRLLFSPNFDLSLADKNGENAFHRAVALRDGIIITQILNSFEENVAQEDTSDQDPEEMPYEVLPSIRNTFSFDLRNNAGQTGLSMALLERTYPEDILDQLVRRTDLTLIYEHGKNALIMAVQNRKMRIAQYILQEAPEQVLVRDEDGHTALYYASRSSDSSDLLPFLSPPIRKFLPKVLDDVEESRKNEVRKVLEQETQM